VSHPHDEDVDLRHILLIEDEQSAIRLFEEAFAELESPIKMTVARDGEQALELLSLQGSSDVGHPDVVVLDLDLPDTDGEEVLRRTRTRDDLVSPPVVVVSNSDDPEVINESYRLGASLYVVKPTGYQDLVDVVREMGRLLGRNAIHYPSFDQTER
jgi:two-component system response regulator